MNENLNIPSEADVLRPFMEQINLRPNKESVVINDLIGIRFSSYRNIIIVCDKRIPIVREGARKQYKGAPIAEIGFLFLHTYRGKQIYIGDSSEFAIECNSPLYARADPSIKVHSTKPISVEYSHLDPYELKNLLSKNIKPQEY